MAILSVNVNKLATLRNARGGNNPDVLQTTLDLIRFGAQGITVHPRPDERHIRRSDVYSIAQEIDVEFNIEGYPSEDFLALVCEVKPAQCTLVPDPPDVLTSNAGWKMNEQFELLSAVVPRLKAAEVRVSLFFDPYDLQGQELEQIKEVGADRIELYTEAFAKSYGAETQAAVVEVYQKAAREAQHLGLGVNAGHDLDLKNLRCLLEEIPEIEEVSIGHALICEALYLGLEETVARYLEIVGSVKPLQS